MAGSGQRLADTEFRAWEHYEDVPPVRESGPTAFVTVQRGCDYKCTFCIVPYTRGPERSRRLADVVREVEQLAGQGTSEVTLLGQTVNSYHDGESRLRRPPARGRSGRRDSAGPVHQPVSHRLLATRHRGDGGHAGRLRARAPAGTERLQRGAEADAAALHPGAVSRSREGSSVRPFPASPSPPTSSSGSRARPRRSSRRPSPWWSRPTSTTRIPSSTRCARARPPCGCATTCRTRWARSGSSGSSRQCGRNARRKSLARVGEVHEVLVERRAKRGDLMLARTRTNHLVLVELPQESVGEYHRVRLTGTTGSTFTGAVVTPALAVL